MTWPVRTLKTRGLPRAVGPDEADPLALLDVQIELVEEDPLAESLFDLSSVATDTS